MNADNPPRKKYFRWRQKKSRSEPDFAEESIRRAANDPSSLSPSSNGFRKLLNKVTKRFARSARQSPNPETTAASSSAQAIPPIQTTKDPVLHTAPTLESNPDLSSNSGIVKAELLPDMELVTETLAHAQTGVAGIGYASTFVQNTSSAADKLQPLPNVIDTFSAILGPLKVFNSVATRLADVHPYAKAALSVFTCASKMILDQANRDDAVHGLLMKVSDVY
ncbi:hypothetical protein DEU56DRAFT_905097, partial [Suillus clintonianus]|uniref:uncharacterized protein n=1 Tax=Suillus clintonianus TaxID=1904413 RepID=UPI001B883BB7